MSMPQSSKRNSRQPKEETQSTNSRAGCAASSRASRTPEISEATPVAVSLWQTNTALIWCCVSALRMSWYCCKGTPVPHSHSTICTSRPRRTHISIHKWLNWPKRAASTLSPGDKVLVSAASQQPVPEDGNTKGVPDWVRKTSRKPVMMVRVSWGKRGERWSSIDTIMARWMRSGTFVGPGTNRKLRPAIALSFQLEGLRSTTVKVQHSKVNSYIFYFQLSYC